MTVAALTERSSGILLHPTSLPSGKLDDDVLRWLDFLSASGQRVWQVLPLGVPAISKSPYQCLSAFAGNPALLPAGEPGEVQADDDDFLQWRERQSYWLEDFTHFALIKKICNGAPWYEWPKPLRQRQRQALDDCVASGADYLKQIEWLQYRIYTAWQTIIAAAHARDIQLFGDMPIFVAYDSADIWAHPDNFLLNEDGHASWVTGVPPDYFSAVGQRWGDPHYNWQGMLENGFHWWLQRMQYHFEWFDLVRLDHFRALEAVWMIDADCDTAIEGHWAHTPGEQMLSLLQQQIGPLPLVAEDLGTITPAVTALRQQFHLPGMSVLQFGFDEFEDNPHRPANITADRVVYTGTHDNDTTRGWFDSLQPHEQHGVRHLLGLSATQDIVDAMINIAMHSNAILSMFPLQDVLKLDSETRMNVPGDTGEQHWQWKFQWQQITPEITTHLQQVTHHAKRC